MGVNLSFAYMFSDYDSEFIYGDFVVLLECVINDCFREVSYFNERVFDVVDEDVSKGSLSLVEGGVPLGV